MALASRLASCFHGGELLVFTGGMGVGKTTFCRGFAQGLGLADEVSSPSYAIVHFYRGNPSLAHFDAWRIENEDDLETAGFYDYLDQGSIVALEWSEKIEHLLEEHKVTVHMRLLANGTREICIEGDCCF